MRVGTITPFDWGITSASHPRRLAHWDDLLRRLAWVHPHEVYKVCYWRDWWLIFRYRFRDDGSKYLGRWSYLFGRQRPAHRVPLLLRLGEP